jgi:hypothetical protein
MKALIYTLTVIEVMAIVFWCRWLYVTLNP